METPWVRMMNRWPPAPDGEVRRSSIGVGLRLGGVWIASAAGAEPPDLFDQRWRRFKPPSAFAYQPEHIDFQPEPFLAWWAVVKMLLYLTLFFG